MVLLSQSSAVARVRLLGHRELDEVVERAARDAERHAGKAHAEHVEHREAIERPGLAPVGVGLAGEAEVVRHEQVLHRIADAAGALQPHDVPVVGHRRVRLREQHRCAAPAACRPARAAACRRARRPWNGRNSHAACRRAAGEAPVAGDAIAAVADDGPRLGIVRPAGRDRARVAEHGAGDLRFDIGRRHRHARTLADAPGDAGVALRDRLHHLEQGRRLDLLAVAGARDQQAEQPRLVQRVEHVVGNAPLAFDAVAGAVDQRDQLARPADQLGGAPLPVRGAWLIRKAIRASCHSRYPRRALER